MQFHFGTSTLAAARSTKAVCLVLIHMSTEGAGHFTAGKDVSGVGLAPIELLGRIMRVGAGCQTSLSASSG